MTVAEETKAYQPTLRDMIDLEVPLHVKIAPDGQQVAVLVRRANWHENCYENICRVIRPGETTYRQLNQTGSVLQLEWVDASSLALLIKGPGVCQIP